MNLTEEQLSEIEEMAGLFISPEDVATNIEMNEEETENFMHGIVMSNMNKIKNCAVDAYKRGWLKTEIELRKAIKQSALNGSSPSQQMMVNFQKEARI